MERRKVDKLQEARLHRRHVRSTPEADAKPPCSFAEGVLAAFQDLADAFSNGRVLQAARHVADLRQAARLTWPGFRNDDLICVRVDDEVGIVRDHDHLALGLGSNEQPDELVKDGLGIKVLFGLVDDQRAIVFRVEREIEQEQHDPARAGGTGSGCRCRHNRHCSEPGCDRCYRATARTA